ncbi:hypothetical protein C7W88_21935 (plasmid) [Novosphingobium sp. THN1]|uniref:hypothetical protein n=1 Tax=Novosphingobium sp. THN1 TaxID=1016987 RepID=UPI000E510FD9|nr:hypothetical protein [Novosphingobium sp. THN1]AXU21492.1 hypothetical protein C7W88_21935 [Novosphingobium sp. THN1]
MDHNRYGFDGLPLVCRQADTEPVTGLPLPGIPQAGASDQIGNPYVLPTVLGGIAIFLIMFAVQSGILG